jgi:hypothetical protein
MQNVVKSSKLLVDAISAASTGLLIIQENGKTLWSLGAK